MDVAQTNLCAIITVLLNFTAIHVMLNGQSNGWCLQPAKKNSKTNQRLLLFVELTVFEKLDITLLLNRPNTLNVNRPLIGFSCGRCFLFKCFRV